MKEVQEISKVDEAVSAYANHSQIVLVDITVNSVFIMRHLTSAEKRSMGYDVTIERFGFHKLNSSGKAALWNTVRVNSESVFKAYLPKLVGRDAHKGIFMYAVKGGIDCADLLTLSKAPF